MTNLIEQDARLIRPLYMAAYPPEAHFESSAEMVSFLNMLWIECAKEHNRFGGRTHGNVRTYNEGCRGPVCRYATRAAYREKNETEPRGVYVWLDPIIAEYKRQLDNLERHWLDKLEIARVTGHLTQDIGTLTSVDEDEVSAKLLALFDKDGP